MSCYEIIFNSRATKFGVSEGDWGPLADTEFVGLEIKNIYVREFWKLKDQLDPFSGTRLWLVTEWRRRLDLSAEPFVTFHERYQVDPVIFKML